MKKNPLLNFYIKILLILLSSGLLIISFYDSFAFASWFCLVPFFVVLSFSTLCQSALFGWVTGILFFAGVTVWFTEYSFIYWLPIIGFLSLYFLFYGIIFYFIYAKVRWTSVRILLVSSIWIAGEYLRHRTFLAFPWGVLGYSQHDFLPLMQLTKITGILGISLLIIMVNLSISEIIRKYIFTGVDKKTPVQSAKEKNFVFKKRYEKYLKQTKPFISLLIITIITVVVVLSGVMYMKLYDYSDRMNKINIALVQPNISFDDKYRNDSAVLIPEPYRQDRFFREDTELVVFPESVIWGTLDRERNKNFKNWVEKTASEEGLHFIMGQILCDEEENYYNAVQLYDQSLNILGRYNKIHPLPCGEYMPYPDILGFLSFLNIAKLNITPANEVITIDYPDKGIMGTNICFESTIPLISRSFRSLGSDLLFTFTDDAGFRDSIASWQHLIFSRVRAIENGSFMVHIGNNGISAIIDPLGVIEVKSELMEKQVLYGKVYFTESVTFFTKYGELIIYTLWGISFAVFIYYLLKKKSGID